MCKIFVMTNTDKVKHYKPMINTIAEHLQKAHLDGFGYAMVGPAGVFGERTTRDTFKTRLGTDSLKVSKSLIKESYNEFGIESKPIGAGIFHGRTSTNFKGLNNTHPINKNGWSLIHNGVVNNMGPTYSQITSNDTEHIVEYLSTTGIKGVEKYVSGYYAVGAIDKDNNLHVIKDSTASLYVAYNSTLDCTVFGTTEELIEDVAKDMKWNIGPIDVVKDNIHMIFNKKGDLISHNIIEPLGWTARESAYSNKSLGHSLNSKDNDYYEKYYDKYKEYEDEQDSLEQYRAEVSNPGAGYKFWDWNHRELTLKEFQELDEVTKLDCLVIRPDGTVVDAEDYYTEKLA